MEDKNDFKTGLTVLSILAAVVFIAGAVYAMALPSTVLMIGYLVCAVLFGVAIYKASKANNRYLNEAAKVDLLTRDNEGYRKEVRAVYNMLDEERLKHKDELNKLRAESNLEKEVTAKAPAPKKTTKKKGKKSIAEIKTDVKDIKGSLQK